MLTNTKQVVITAKQLMEVLWKPPMLPTLTNYEKLIQQLQQLLEIFHQTLEKIPTDQNPAPPLRVGKQQQPNIEMPQGSTQDTKTQQDIQQNGGVPRVEQNMQRPPTHWYSVRYSQRQQQK